MTDSDSIVDDFVIAAQTGTHKEDGCPHSAYTVSKTAITQLSRVLSELHLDIRCYACCPGLYRTDMAGGHPLLFGRSLGLLATVLIQVLIHLSG